MLNDTKQLTTVFVFHLDTDGVAKLHVLGLRLAILDGFDRALFRNAAVTLGPIGLALVLNARVADGARPDDAPGAHIACPTQMRNELAKMKCHVRARVAHTHLAAIPSALERQMQTTFFPRRTELVRCNRHRTECSGRFALKKAKTLGHFARNQVTQRHVVGQHHQSNAVQRLLGRAPHGDVGGDHGDLGLKVDAQVFAGQAHIVTRP